MKRILTLVTLGVVSLGSIISHTDASTLSRNEYRDYKLNETQSYLIYLGENKNEYVFLDTSFESDNIVYYMKDDVKRSDIEVLKSLTPKKAVIGEYEDQGKWELKGVSELK